MIDFQRGQALEHIGEVILRIDSAAAAAAQDGVDDSASPAGIGMSNEEPALAAHGRGADGVFDQVVVDFKSAVTQVARQSIVFV